MTNLGLEMPLTTTFALLLTSLNWTMPNSPSSLTQQ